MGVHFKLSHRHCELRSSDAIQDKYNSRLDCFTASQFAMTAAII